MPGFINRIKYILSDKWTSIAIISLAIVARVIQLIFFYNLRVDGMYQVMAMQNFAEGHGISTAKVLPADLSAIVYERLINWPPGYSILLSPFYILTGHNYMLAGIILDVLAAIAMIFTCRAILRTLDTPAWLFNLFTLLTAFFIYYFYFINSSDAIAISFFLGAIFFALQALKKNKFSSGSIIAITACLFISGLIKYLFIPVVFIVPLFIALKGWSDKNRSFLRAGILSIVVLVVLLGGGLAWQKLNTGSAVYISEPTRDFYPDNLLGAHPAIPASFINPDTVTKVTSASVSGIIFRIFQSIHLFLLIGLSVYMLRRIFRKGFKALPLHKCFFYLGYFLLLGISLVLVILSLRVGKEENIPGHLWTYVEEPRYYGLIHVLVQLSVFILYVYQRTKALKYIAIGCMLLLLPETFRGMIFTANRVTDVKQERYTWQNEWEIQDYADMTIRKNKKSGQKVVVSGSSYYINYRVSLYSHIPVLVDWNALIDPASVNTKQPVMLLLILEEKDLFAKENFIREHENKLAGYFRGFYFYTIHVNPH